MNFTELPDDGPEASTCHTNPNWINMLKSGFKSEVISMCSTRTREAVAKNEYIENNYEFRKVKAELVSSLMEAVKRSFGSVGRPSIDQWRDLAVQLGFEYATMFRDTGNHVEGRRKPDPIKRLAQKLCDNFR